MNKHRLRKLKAELEAIQCSPSGVRAKELIAIAKRLGRTKCNRGKEPTWVREDCPELSPPLSIPNHPGEMKKGTVLSIVEALLSDVDEWELYLAKEDQ